MKTTAKSIIRSIALALVLIITASLFPVKSVQAEETLEQAKKGIVQVNLVYTDDDGKTNIIEGGTGFLIGSPDENNPEEYVVTCKHIVEPDKSYIKSVLLELGVSEQDVDSKADSVEYEVVVAGDVSTNASLYLDSDNLDMAVLKLNELLTTRTMFSIYTSEDGSKENVPYKNTDSVYTLGFPAAIDYANNPAYYGNDQVVMSSGHIMNIHTLNDTHVITHDIPIGMNNCGGPLLDANGNVIGMNILSMDGDYFVAIDASEMVDIFDSFGMKYGKVTPTEETETDDSDDDDDNKIDPIVKPDTSTIPIAIIVIAVVFGVIFIVLMVLVVILLRKQRDNLPKAEKVEKKEKKKKKKEQQVPEKPFDPNWNVNSNISSASGTSILNAETCDETSILQNNDGINTKVSHGKIIRKKTGENIDLTKDRTVIGKDSLHVDYCIRDNSAISRMHLIVAVNPNGVYAEDAHSTNGTFINGRRLAAGEQCELRGGENIRLGNEEFIFRK